MPKKIQIQWPASQSNTNPGSVGAFISTGQPPIPKPIPESVAKNIQNRAEGLQTVDVLGSLEDVNAIGHESLLPALIKQPIATAQPRIQIGGSQCLQPYEASYLNSSALSFGPMGKRFILALNRAAFQAGFYQNTGEAGLSPFHLGMDVDIESDPFDAEHFFKSLAALDETVFEQTGDLVWQLGNGYFGCRTSEGAFDPAQFQLKARLKPVKMIELKLSQGVEPLARMPVKTVTRGLEKLMGIENGQQAKLQSSHAAFNSPCELLRFVAKLRDLSGGKPVGIKMGVSHRHYFLAVCKAMRKTGIYVDFITVDGMEGGTAAAQGGTLGFTGTALNDAVLFVHNALVGTRLRHEVRIIASGQVFTERDMVEKLARGADLCATARGMMLSVGCDQQLQCYLGTCPRGIATQDVQLMKNFNTLQNTQRLVQYHAQTIAGFNTLVAMAGLTHPAQLQPFHLQKRISHADVLPLDEIYELIRPGALLAPFGWAIPKRFRRAWKLADADAPFSQL